MPVLHANITLKIPKGSKTAEGECDGHHPVDAMQDAVENFEAEHGYEPEQDERLSINIYFTTFDTHCELVQRPEES